MIKPQTFHLNLVPAVIPPKSCMVKADSGATAHYFKATDADILENLKLQQGAQVRLPEDRWLY